MAMEKLMLRSVLYGVDKIPDKWFDKVPGGFFREKGTNSQNSDSPNRNRRNNKKDGRRQYDEDDVSDDDGYRSEGHGRRHRRYRSSYDGGADDDDYHLSGDERHRRRSGTSHKRRHSTEDDQRGHGNHHRRSHQRDSRDVHDPAFNPYRRPDLRSPDLYDRDRPLSSGYGSDRSANRFSMGSSAAAAHPPYQHSSATMSPAMQSPTFSNVPPARSGSMSNGYVPYANIYGQTTQPPTQQQPFSAQPASPMRPPQPYSDFRNSPPVAPPPRGYHQNPFAQDAATAADAGAGAAYDGNAGFVNQERDPRWSNGPDPNYSARLYTRYDENDDAYPDPASPRRSSRRDYSPTYDSYGDRTQDRRSRSERRPDDRPRAGGKSKSRVREAFDTSQRGLGYGAVGAVTGGLLGSEFGKGPIPTAIGATVGALGANAFEAREKYVHTRDSPRSQRPSQPSSPATDRRKDGRRDSEYKRDGPFERRDSRRKRDEGYYSD